MEHATKLFPGGLPTLEELKHFNAGKGVPPETAWIWGKDDEVCAIVPSCDKVTSNHVSIFYMLMYFH